jgi:AcrR family transcriptional regulator
MTAAREIIAEQGAHALTMTALAEYMNVGKPTLYLRWDNARALADAADEQAREEMSDTTAAVYNSAVLAMDALAREPDGAFLLEMLVNRMREER